MRYLCRHVLEHCPDDLAFFDQRVQPGLVGHARSGGGSAFERLTYTEAVEILEKADGPSSSRWPGAATCSPSTSAT